MGRDRRRAGQSLWDGSALAASVVDRRRLLKLGAAALVGCAGGSSHGPGSGEKLDAGGDSGKPDGDTGTDTGSPPNTDGTCGPDASTVEGDTAGARTGRFTSTPFLLGVASGDPLHDRVVIWTRLVVEPTDVASTPTDEVDVIWEVSTTEDFADVLFKGMVATGPDVGHSVHVDVDGLDSDAVYWYRFVLGEFTSPVGRTRTLPCVDAQPALWRMGFATCQNWLTGFYAAHRSMAEQKLDLIVFLGDYIYEGGNAGPVRDHGSSEPTTLEGYRNRHGLYRSDPDLQACHASAPWVVIQDDHEVDNNYTGVLWRSAEDTRARLAAAYQAWWEHMPVRVRPQPDGSVETQRSLHIGTLAQVVVLDGRQYRDDQPCGDVIGPRCDEADDDRAFLGAEQEAWLDEVIAENGPKWTIVGSPVVMLPMDFGGAFLNPDQWDGYPAARQRFIDAFDTHSPDTHVVVFSGDIHCSGWGWVPADPFVPDGAARLSEVIVTPISSIISDDRFVSLAGVLAAQPHIGWFDATHNGWVEAELSEEEMQVRYWSVVDITSPSSPVEVFRELLLTRGTVPAYDPLEGG